MALRLKSNIESIAWNITTKEPDTNNSVVFNLQFNNKTVSQARDLIRIHDNFIEIENDLEETSVIRDQATTDLERFYKENLTKDIRSWNIEQDDGEKLPVNDVSISLILATGYTATAFKRGYLDFIVKIRDGKSLTEKEEETKNLLALANGGGKAKRRR